MSDIRRASPVEPPSGIRTPDNMAQVSRPPPFIGHPDHSSLRPSLPPIQGPPSRPRYEGRSLPPMRLPPSQPGPISQPSSQRGQIAISQLLSNNSPSPPRSNAPASAHRPVQLPSYRSPATSYGSSPVESRPHPYPFAPTIHQQRQHRLDNPPVVFRTSQPIFQSEPLLPQAPHTQFRSNGYESDQAHHSPAVTAYSSTSGHYDTYSEPSPGRQTLRMSIPPPLNYNLSVRQQPAAARACGFGERDRRVIDPPPIIELKITDKMTRHPEQDPCAMLALHCTLRGHDGRDDETEAAPPQPDMPHTRRLMGTLVASPYQAKDENGIAGTFFVFPDLSCRTPGKFRLHFKLLRVDPTNNSPGVAHGTVASIVTDVFNVYTAKDFPGMRASSGLLKSLRRQGLNVGVKKGYERRKGKTNRTKKVKSSDDEDEESGSDDGGSRSESSPGAAKGAKKKVKRKRTWA